MTTAALFPGQGSQFVGMGRDLYEAEPAARAVFEAADSQLGYALSALCFEGPEDALTETAVQQPALFATSLAAWTVMQARGEADVAFMAGHSLGEFSALVAAGSLSFADGLALVQRRGQLMKRAGQEQPGAMAAVLGLDVKQVADACAAATDQTGKVVQVANDNCPGQIVISGDVQALDGAVELLQAAGARKIVNLPISIAAHSPLMASVAGEFAQAVEETPINTPSVPVIGNVSAGPLTDPAAIRQELKSQLTAPVAWTASIQYLLGEGVDTFIETGPGDVLLGLVKRIDRSAQRIKFEVGAAAWN
ncbi:MAG: ACP S-malonyltransferase [Chloroflexota bacterium]